MENFQIVQKGLEILRKHLEAVLVETFKKMYGEEYLIYMEYGPKQTSFMKDYAIINKKYKDVLFFFNAIIKNWEIIQSLFSSNYVLCLCHTLKYFRNKWAHQSPFSLRETYRFLDESQAMLEEIKAETIELDQIRKEILHNYYEEELNKFINGNQQQVLPTQHIQPISDHTNIPLIINENPVKSNEFSLFNKQEAQKNIQNIPYYNYDLMNPNSNNFEMMDGNQIERELIHERNFDKLFSQNKQSQDKYKVSFFNDEEK
jgi:hypothetical protein